MVLSVRCLRPSLTSTYLLVGMFYAVRKDSQKCARFYYRFVRMLDKFGVECKIVCKTGVNVENEKLNKSKLYANFFALSLQSLSPFSATWKNRTKIQVERFIQLRLSHFSSLLM